VVPAGAAATQWQWAPGPAAPGRRLRLRPAMTQPQYLQPCAPAPAQLPLLLLLSRLPAAVAAAAPPLPDVVFLLADDLGYNEMNFMNRSRGLRTPHLDRLAFDGIILRNYYVQPICSPTRSALLTGRYTIRLGTQSNVVWWDSPWGLPLNETLLSQNLADAGYTTALFGKCAAAFPNFAHR
jgi:hypothetical protein